VQYASEVGKMAGHLSRQPSLLRGLTHGALGHFGLRFDWFAQMKGMEHIPRKERSWSGVRCACYAAAAAGAV